MKLNKESVFTRYNFRNEYYYVSSKLNKLVGYLHIYVNVKYYVRNQYSMMYGSVAV